MTEFITHAHKLTDQSMQFFTDKSKFCIGLKYNQPIAI